MAKNKLNYWELSKDHKIIHILKNRSVVGIADIQKIMRESNADISDLAIQSELDSVGMRPVGDGKYFTSEGIYNAETAIYKTAVGRSQETDHHLPDDIVETVIASRETIRDEQADAVRHVAKSGGISIIEGAAGVGKSFAMDAVREAYEKAGYQVLGTALSNVAVKSLKDGSSIKEANTMYSLYQQIANKNVILDSKTIIIADEAGMADSKSMARIMSLAHNTGAKVVALGDRYQLESIGSASMFSKIGDKIGKAEMIEIARQDDPILKSISLNFFNGKSEKAFNDAERLGMIENNIDPAGYAAKKYLSYTSKGKDTIVLAGTNKNVSDVNQRVIELLKEQGELSDDKSVDLKLTDRNDKAIEKRMYVDQKVMFRQGNKELNIENGDSGKIIDVNGQILTIEKSDGSSVDVDTNEYKRIEDGYAMTVHKSQGLTIDKAILYADMQTMDLRLIYVAMTRAREGTDMVAHPDEMVAIKFKAMTSSVKLTVVDVMTESELAQLNTEASASIKAIESNGQDLVATHGIMENDSIKEQQGQLASQRAYNKLISMDLEKEMEQNPSKTFSDTSGDARDFDGEYSEKMIKKLNMENSESQADNFIKQTEQMEHIYAQESDLKPEDLASTYRDGVDNSSLTGIRSGEGLNNKENVDAHKASILSRLNAGSEVSEGKMIEITDMEKSISDFASRQEFDEDTLKASPSYLLRPAYEKASLKISEEKASFEDEKLAFRDKSSLLKAVKQELIKNKNERGFSAASKELEDLEASFALRKEEMEVVFQEKEDTISVVEDEIERRERIADRYSEMGVDDLKDRLASMNPEIFYDIMVGNASNEEDRQRNKDIFFEAVDERMSGMQAVSAFSFAERYEKEEVEGKRRFERSNEESFTENRNIEDKYKGVGLKKESDLKALDLPGEVEPVEKSKNSEDSRNPDEIKKDYLKQDIKLAIARSSKLGLDRTNEINQGLDTSTPEGKLALKEELVSIKSRQTILKKENDGSIRNFKGSAAQYINGLLTSKSGNFGDDPVRASDIKIANDAKNDRAIQEVNNSRGGYSSSNGFNETAEKDRELRASLLIDEEYNSLQRRFEEKAKQAGLTDLEIKEVYRDTEQNLILMGDIPADVSSISPQEISNRALSDVQASALRSVGARQVNPNKDNIDDLLGRSDPDDSKMYGDNDAEAKIEMSRAEVAREEFIDDYILNEEFDARVEKITDKGVSEDKAIKIVSNNIYTKKAITEVASNITENKKNKGEVNEGEQQDASNNDEQHIKNLIELQGIDRLQSKIDTMKEIEQSKLEKMEKNLEKSGVAIEKSDIKIENINKEIELQSKQKTKFFGLVKDNSNDNKAEIQDLEKNKKIETEKNQERKAAQELLASKVESQRENVESLSKVSEEADRINKETIQKEAERVIEEKERVEQEAQKAEELIQDENNIRISETITFKEDEAQYAKNDQGQGSINLVEDEQKRQIAEDQKIQQELEAKIQRDAELVQISEELEIMEVNTQEDNLTEDNIKNQEVEVNNIDDKKVIEQEQVEIEVDSTNDKFDDSKDDSAPSSGDGSTSSYSKEKSQAADNMVDESIDSGEYQVAKNEMFSSSNLDMLSKLSNQFSNKDSVEEKNVVDKSKTKTEDQFQNNDESKRIADEEQKRMEQQRINNQLTQ